MGGMYPDIEVHRIVPPRVDGAAQSFGTPASNGTKQNNQKNGGSLPIPAHPTASAPILPVYASQTYPTQCGMSTIGSLEIFMVYLIALKFLLIVGIEIMPENVCRIIALVLYFIFVFLICLDDEKSKKLKILLPCFGSQVIRLGGILIFCSYHFYGYFKKDDILFPYKYNTKDDFFTFLAIIFWTFDVFAAIWVIAVVIKCHAYLRRLNKNYQSRGAFNIM